MFNRRRSAISLVKGVRHWRPSAESVAIAAAAGGEPGPLLALKGVDPPRKQVDAAGCEHSADESRPRSVACGGVIA